MTRNLCAGVLLLLLIGPLAVQGEVKTSHKDGTQFSSYHTYAWRAWPDLHPEHPLVEGSMLDLEVKSRAQVALARSGLELTDSGKPDLWISYTAIVTDTVNIDGVRKEVAKGVAWIGDPRAHGIVAYEEGTLVFEIYDAESDIQIWSGWSTEVAETRKKLRKKGLKAISKILRHYPPN
ncbi:MAG: DUF4136 domain-containing protein [Thermoanaerobaculia bacterium]